MLLRQRTLHQLMRAQREFSCTVDMVSRILLDRVDRPAQLDGCLRFQGRLSSYNRECGRCDSVTSPITQLLHCHSRPATQLSYSPSHLIATPLQPIDCHCYPCQSITIPAQPIDCHSCATNWLRILSSQLFPVLALPIGGHILPARLIAPLIQLGDRHTLALPYDQPSCPALPLPRSHSHLMTLLPCQ